MTKLEDSLELRTAITSSCLRIDFYADEFIGSVRSNATTLHRIVICSSGCNPRRDLNSVMMFCVSSHLNVACRGSTLE
jgi:hypothetical protein